MADNPKPKRRLMPAQTVRERAQTVQDSPVKKKKITGLGRIIARAFKKIALPFKKAGLFLSKYTAFRIIGRITKFIGRIIIPKYIRTSWQELRQVTWPDRRESRRLTFAVLAFAVVFGAVVATMDYGLSHLFKTILLGSHQ